VSIIEKIKALEKKRQDLLNSLLQERPMMRGSFGKAYIRCGIKTCHCSKGSLHPYFRITWMQQSHGRTKTISKAEAPWFKMATTHYKGFRKTRRQIQGLEQQIRSCFDQLEYERIEKTKRQKGYSKTASLPGKRLRRTKTKK
jgi:hypothetical protein